MSSPVADGTAVCAPASLVGCCAPPRGFAASLPGIASRTSLLRKLEQTSDATCEASRSPKARRGRAPPEGWRGPARAPRDHLLRRRHLLPREVEAAREHVARVRAVAIHLDAEGLVARHEVHTVVLAR